MMEVPRRPQRLSVAIPSSFTKDVPHLREKTSRVGLIARSLAIFRVDEVVVYYDQTGSSSAREADLLEKLLTYQETTQDLTISTSRGGKQVREMLNDLTLRWKLCRRPLVLFGSPSEGVPEILAKEGTDLSKVVDFNLNMIPNQGVETVRTEEAILATMSILNLLEET